MNGLPVFTHADLCAIGYRWLLGKRGGCVIAAAEPSAGCSWCIPDAIGWAADGRVTLIEAKRTLSDYAADGKKLVHTADRIPGHRRWYLTPAGLIAPDRLREGWGLLEVGASGRVRVVREAPAIEPSSGGSRESSSILIGIARRLRDGGIIDPQTGRLSPWHEVVP